MTGRLYYDDCYLRDFQAAVVDAGPDGRSIVLDKTAFYPTSGGQPQDTGTIAGIAVLDVVDAGDRILHLTELPVPAGEVLCRVDWRRRFDHMQQHTGQHLLSAVLADMFGLQTVSFHLGAESSTIDVAAPSLTPEQVRAAEARAFEIVFENRPVRIEYQDASAAEGLRKASDREGTLRIISIEGLDKSACGGTHVRATGEIGPVLLRRLDKIRGNTRVEFLCGRRAIDRARLDFDILTRIAQSFSSAIDETPALVAAQIARITSSEKARRKLSMELAQIHGRDLHAQTPCSADGMRRYRKTVPAGAIDEETRTEAQSFTSQSKAIYLATSDEPATLLLATSSDSEINAGEVLKAFLKQAGGKGGGTPQMAQGSLPDKSKLAEFAVQLGFTQ
jgi:alanyl-tRNA synthetase